jgi:3-oxoacyl-[acyl-carrier protein] reductase
MGRRDQFGRLGSLVNNAGIAHMTPTAEFTDNDFERSLLINVRGAFTPLANAPAA